MHINYEVLFFLLPEQDSIALLVNARKLDEVYRVQDNVWYDTWYEYCTVCRKEFEKTRNPGWVTT